MYRLMYRETLDWRKVVESCTDLRQWRRGVALAPRAETKRREPRCAERRRRDIELLGPLPVGAGARGTSREVRGDPSFGS